MGLMACVAARGTGVGGGSVMNGVVLRGCQRTCFEIWSGFHLGGYL